jgi:hypothetical protein
MYQCEVRPRSGHICATQPASEQQGKPIIRGHSRSRALSLLLSFSTNRLLRRSVLAVLAGCLVTFFSGCGGVTFNSSSSQKGSGGTPTAATLTMISCGVQSMTGGQTKACSVYLSASATSSTTVSLTSSDAALKLPPSVVIAAGQKSADFNAVTLAVTKSVSVTITANAQGVTETDVVTLNPVAESPTSPVATLNNVSCGMQSLTGPMTMSCSVSLSGAASSQTLVTLSSSSSALRAPASVTVPKGGTSTPFSVTAAAVNASQKATLTATADGASKSDVIMLYPASPTTPAPVATLKGLSCGTNSITGAQTEVCSVSLTAATTSQTVVKLSSSSSALRAPGSVTVSKDETSATFSVTATAVSALQKATLTATADGASKSDVITLYPTQTATPTLSKVSCGTQSLTGAQTKECSVALSEAATSQTVVKLSSSSNALHAPASVIVPKGGISATFSVTASAVNASQRATLTATADGVSQTEVIMLYPAQAGATPTLSKVSCGTQTLTGPATEACSVYLSAAAVSATVVALSSSKSVLQVPGSVTVAAGSTSASFAAKASIVTTTQSVTLTATSNGVSQTDVLQLQGTSASQPSATPHEVQLSWEMPSTSSDTIAGFHVYRTTGGSSNYSILSSLDTNTTYTDSTVQSGTTYDYVVKSVDFKGVESVPSNPVSVTIP